MFLKIEAQAFETGDFRNFFLRFSYKIFLKFVRLIFS